MLKRLVLVMLSAAGFAAAAAVVCQTLARLQGRAVGATIATLDGTARALEAALAPTGNDLPQLASHLAGAANLGTELKQLVTTKTVLAAAKGPAVVARARYETARTKIEQHLTALRAATPGVDGLMIVGETGEVLISDVPAFAAGQQLAAPAGGQAEGGDAFAALGDAASITGPARARAPLQAALGGTPARAAFADEGRLTWVATAPLLLKNKIVGAVLVQRHLPALPRAAADAFVTVDGKAVLGVMPASAHLPLNPPERPFVLAATEVQLPVYAPVLAEAVVSAGSPAGEPRAGLWAARFRVPGIDEAHAFVTADLSASWAEVAQAQTRVLMLLGALWIVHSAFLLLLGVRVRRGVGRMTQLAAAAAQGGPAPAFDEHQVVPELRPLAGALLTLARRSVGAPAAGEGGPPFAPVSGRSASPVAVAGESVAMSPPAGPPVADDGFRPFSETAEPAIMTPALDGPPSPLPGAAESMVAVEHLASVPPALDLAYDPGAVAAPVVLDDTRTPVGPPPVTLDRPAGPSPVGFDEVTKPRGVVAVAPDFEPPVETAAPDLTELGAASEPPASGPKLEPMAEAAPSAPVELVEPLVQGAPGAPGADDEQTQVALHPQPDVAAPGAAPGLSDPDDAPAPDASAVFALAREVAQRPLSNSAQAALDERSPAAAARDDILSISTDDTGEHQALSRPGAHRPGDADTAVAPPPRAPAPPKPAPRAAPLSPEEAEQILRKVYEEFVAARKGCGEPGELPFEKFRARLDESRSAVIAKHACKEVRFQVYVKNGRAAIKATPG